MSKFEVKYRWVGTSLDRAFAELEEECAQIVRGLTIKIWDMILARTPQYTGAMAASWTYSLNSPQFYDRSDMVEYREYKGQWQEMLVPRRKGYMEAIEISEAASLGNAQPFKLGDTVYISNGVIHDWDSYRYSEDVETGVINLRGANRPGQPVKRTVDAIGVRYGKDMTANAGRLMRAMKIGGIDASDST